jgi:hypothetical protein
MTHNDYAGSTSLDLSHCTSITDVSALGGVTTLDLSECDNITDVSALGGVTTLKLVGTIEQHQQAEAALQEHGAGAESPNMEKAQHSQDH